MVAEQNGSVINLNEVNIIESKSGAGGRLGKEDMLGSGHLFHPKK